MPLHDESLELDYETGRVVLVTQATPDDDREREDVGHILRDLCPRPDFEYLWEYLAQRYEDHLIETGRFAHSGYECSSRFDVYDLTN